MFFYYLKMSLKTITFDGEKIEKNNYEYVAEVARVIDGDTEDLKTDIAFNSAVGK